MSTRAGNTPSRPTIAVISIGEMGFGIARLLMYHSYPVVTNLDGRSQVTRRRAEEAGIKVLSLPELVLQSNVILSIVPPKDALEMGKSITMTSKKIFSANSTKRIAYLDLNAISPRLSTEISNIVNSSPNLTFVDGAILNFPPKLLEDGTWFRPVLITSGPMSLAVPDHWRDDLISALNIRHVSPKIGAASGLKMCFGSVYKGHVAIAIQAYTAAKNLGVLPELRGELMSQFPVVTETFEKGMLGSQQKAYRWIKEMEEVGETFSDEGMWNKDIFKGVADVFRVVAEREDEKLQKHAEIEGFVDEVCNRMQAKSKL